MDVVVGARWTLGRHKNWKRTSKSRQPQSVSLCCPQCSGTSVRSSRGVAASFRTRCSGSIIFVLVAAATSAWCRGSSQQNIVSQMFLQLPTLRRHVSRAVAAGVSLPYLPLASRFLLSCSLGGPRRTNMLVATVADLRMISLLSQFFLGKSRGKQKPFTPRGLCIDGFLGNFERVSKVSSRPLFSIWNTSISDLTSCLRLRKFEPSDVPSLFLQRGRSETKSAEFRRV